MSLPYGRDYDENGIPTPDGPPDHGDVDDLSQADDDADGRGGFAEDFWCQTQSLVHVRDFARARMVSPWAMLGVSLARVVASVPPSVKLPALVGSYASLNLFVGLVGSSGNGKGAVERAGAAAFEYGDIYETGIGSGEGINHVFARYDKDAGTVQVRDAALFSVSEIDSLAALGSRQSSTLLPQLRKAWSGEDLTFAYATKDKALRIPAHSYRMALIAGVQPGRAGFLLGDSDGGTPQRFLWLPTLDPGAPDEPPAEPEELPDVRQNWPLKQIELVLPSEAVDVVRRNRLARLRGEQVEEALDGHLTLCRIKVAAALTLLDGRRAVTSDDWSRSARVMAVSQMTRASVERHLEAAATKAHEAQGRAEGLRAVASEDVQSEAAVRRVSQWIARKLRTGETIRRNALRRDAVSRDRKYFDEALGRLVDAGAAEIVPTARGEGIRAPETQS